MSDQWRNRIVDYGEEAPDQLLANPRNFRMHPKHQQDALAGVLRDVGVVQDVIVNQRTGFLLDGHLRVSLALRDGQAAIPVKYVDLSPDEEALVLSTFDPISAMAATDAAKLDELLRDVSTGDAAVQQMLDDLAQAAGIVPGLAEPGDGGDDFDTTPQAGPTRCLRGDLWVLGKHRLLCGDSTNAEDVARLMGGERAAMCWADPPYGMNFQSNHRTASPQFDHIAGDDEPLIEFMPLMLEIPVWYICCRWDVASIFMAAINDNGFAVINWIVWHKSRGGMGDLSAAYRPTHETILYCSRHRTPFAREGRDDDTWDIDTDAPSSYEHPTQKPVKVPQRAIENHSRAGDIVYDPFYGSGPSVIAAERTGRRCFGIEIEPRYCDVILRRWEAETGQTAELVTPEGTT